MRFEIRTALRISVLIFVISVISVVNAFSQTGAISSLAYSPDGKRLAVGMYGQVVLYDTSNWTISDKFLGVEDTARALAFSPDSQEIAIGDGLMGRSGRVVFWNPANNQATHKWPALFQDNVEAVCYRSDGKGLLVGANDNKARFYGALPDAACKVLDEHNGRVQAVAFSSVPDTIFVTGAMDKIVKVWDAKKATTVINFDQSQAGITGLVFLPGGRQFVGSSLDGRLRWWQVNYDARRDAYQGGIVRNQDAHPNGALALAISADGKRIISSGMDGGVSVWDASNGNRFREFKDATQPVYAVALSPDGKIAAGAGRDGVVRIWDVEGKMLTSSLIPPVLPPPPPAPKPAAAATKPAAKRTKKR